MANLMAATAVDTDAAAQLEELHKLETKVAELLQIAGRAVAVLANEQPSQEEFEQQAGAYFDTLKDVQLRLRQQLKSSYLSNVQYLTNNYTEEKELAVATSNTAILREMLGLAISEAQQALDNQTA